MVWLIYMLFFNLSRKSHLSQCFLDISLFPKNKAKLSVILWITYLLEREGGREGGTSMAIGAVIVL